MLSCSGNNFTVPHNPNPSGNDILAAVGGYLDVHPSSVVLEFGWHFGVSVAVSKAADLTFVGVYCPGELVDAAAGFGEPLVGDGCALLYCRDEAICDGMCSVGEIVVLHVEDGFS